MAARRTRFQSLIGIKSICNKAPGVAFVELKLPFQSLIGIKSICNTITPTTNPSPTPFQSLIGIKSICNSEPLKALSINHLNAYLRERIVIFSFQGSVFFFQEAGKSQIVSCIWV